MGAPGAKKAVILAQPVVQKALALLVNEFGVRKPKKGMAGKNQVALDTVLNGVGKIDWRHSNKLWSVWLSDNPERDSPGITPYLPKDIAKAKGEFATVDHSRVRFGVKHNEIAPAIANLIRYSLSLPAKKGR